jgi:outer membrane cobalamin receptor
MRRFKFGKPAHSDLGAWAFLRDASRVFLSWSWANPGDFFEMKPGIYALFMVLSLLLVARGEAITTLDPVVVTATRTAQPSSQVAAAVTVITAEQIAKSGATSLAEVLRGRVGLQLVANGSNGALATPSIRGSEAAQVLVLLDGLRLNSAQNGLFDLSNLPVSLAEIERIEVLRGPASALYGSNAMGGVIQIFTRTPDAVPLNTLAWSEGSHNSRSLSFSTSGKKDRLRYRLGVGGDKSDGFRENSDQDQTTLDALFGLELEGGFDLQLSAYYLNKAVGVPGSTDFPSPYARQGDENGQVALTLAGPVGPVAFSVRGIYLRQRNTFKDPGAFFPSDDRHLVETFGAEFQGESRKGSHHLLFGGDFYQDDLASSSSGHQSDERWSGFVQDELELTSWARFLLGMRYDAHADFANELSPRAAASFSLSASTKLRASVSRSFRAPTLNDRFWPDTGWSKGNPDLNPETAWEYELAVDQGLGHWGDFGLSLFRRDAQDLIDWQEDSNFVWSPVNVNKARIWGVEAELDLRLNRMLGTGGNYTYLHPKDLDSGEFLEAKPQHQANLYFEIGPIWNTHLRLDGRYVQHYARATGEINRYSLVDAGLSRPFVFGNGLDLEVKIALKNLFNQEYAIKAGYPMPKQELFVGVTAYF